MNLDFLHPYPRYGAAVALEGAGLRPEDVASEEDAARLVAEALDLALTRFMLYTADNPKLDATDVLRFTYVKAAALDPSKGASRGYYLYPHVLTSDKARADTLKEVRALRDALRGDGNVLRRVELKKSFAPLTSKLNNGGATMQNPKASLLNAAFTALATLTPEKPAAYAGGNTAIIPDLPLVEDGHTPLLDFVRLFGELRRSRERGDAFVVKLAPKKAAKRKKGESQPAEDGAGERGYKRPPFCYGNYPEAPGGSVGAVSLLAAVGRWVREGRLFAGEDRLSWAQRVLDRLAERPLYVVSYGGTRQETFGHHLVGLALEHDLGAVASALRRTKPFGVERFSDPKQALFQMMSDRFLRLFTHASFHDFLAFRAEYDAALAPVIHAYVMKSHPDISPELVASARAYGARLNYAAYRAAREEVKQDAKKGRDLGRDTNAYKQRFLVELESAVQSAKSGPALLAQVGTRVGRLTGYDLNPEGGPFMEAVASGEIPLATARDLVMAFMRLSTYQPKEGNPAGSDADVSTSLGTDPYGPGDPAPDDRLPGAPPVAGGQPSLF